MRVIPLLLLGLLACGGLETRGGGGTSGSGGSSGPGGGSGASGTSSGSGTAGTSGAGGAVGTGGSTGSGVGGSGGASGSGSAGGDINCDYKVAGIEECFTYSGLPTMVVSAIKSSCLRNAGATTPASCPTANLSGCCEDIKVGAGSAGYSYGYCTYGEPSVIPGLESACKTAGGIWK